MAANGTTATTATAAARAPRARSFAVETPVGPAGIDLDPARSPAGLLMLGHGAGGDVDAPDLVAVRDAARGVGWTVARVTQPYRRAGRRAPAPAAQLDAAWTAVVADLTARRGLRRLPVVHGGRSSGARVACRCAGPEAAGVVALAFPVHPPGRSERSRLDELDAVSVPLLVVQGERDAFGRPPEELFGRPGRTLVTVPGADHALRRDPGAVGAAVASFLARLTLPG